MKRCYIITFSLKNPGINQQELIKHIKTAKVWANLGTSAFLVYTDKTASEIRDILLKFLKLGDKIYVGLLDESAAWYGLGDEVSNWIRNNQKK